jgi:hypothetical protein
MIPTNGRTIADYPCETRYARHEVTAPRVMGPSGRTEIVALSEMGPMAVCFRFLQENGMRIDDSTDGGLRGRYQRRMLELRGAFEASGASGAVTIAARAAALDEMVKALWAQAVEQDARLASGTALVALGGYGRRELFPYSDVDLLFLLDGKIPERDLKDAIRQVNQEMWDCGIRVSPMTRRLA